MDPEVCKKITAVKAKLHDMVIKYIKYGMVKITVEYEYE